MKTPTNQLCPHCGGNDEQLNVLGPLCTIVESNYAGLRSFFRGEYDDYECSLCGKKTGIRPTVLLEDPFEKKSWLCFGERAEGFSPEKKEKIISIMTAEGQALETCASLEELKRLCAKRVSARMERVTPALIQSDAERQALIKGEWREFPSSHFTAAVLMLTTRLPDVRLGLGEGTTLESAIKAVSDLQASVWIGFCVSWSEDKTKGRSMQSELLRYVGAEAMIHTAADEFVLITEKTDSWSQAGKFCIEVVRAYLLAARGRPNPRPKELAKLYVECEVLRQAKEHEIPAWVQAQDLSVAYIQSILTYQDVFAASAEFVGQHGLSALRLLEPVGKRAGFPDLADELALSVKPEVDESKKIPVEKMLEALGQVTKHREAVSVLQTATRLLPVLNEKLSPEILDRVAEGLEKIVGCAPETRARVLTWLAARLLEERWPQAVLDRIGAKPEEWEQSLPFEIQADLWVERSNAFRMAGRRAEAIAVAEAVFENGKAANDVESLWSVRRNLAILYREAGEPERALEVFQELLPKADRGQKLDLLHSIATTYSAVGRPQDGLPYLEEAKQLAGGHLSEENTRITVALALVHSVGSEPGRALALLREIPAEAVDKPDVLVSYASAWGNLLQEPDLLTSEDRKNLTTLFERLDSAQEQTYEAGNFRVHLDIVRVLAFLADLLRIGPRNPYCERLDARAREFEKAPDPWALVALARDELAAGHRDKAMGLLLELPSAVAARFATERDVGLKVNSLQALARVFDQVVALLIRRPGSIEDVRIVAELQRDFFGRRHSISGENGKAVQVGFVKPDSETIRQLPGPAAVLEWVSCVDGVVGIMSRVDGNGKVTVADLSPSPVDLDELGPRINQRLSTWTGGRKGDPFDAVEWKEFEQWLAAEVEAHLPDGGQLVIVEHPEVAGLPWHVAAAPRWRTSYVPSWSAILGSKKESPPNLEPVLGVAFVPRFKESPAVFAAMEKSAKHIVDLAHRLNRPMHQAMREDCDRAAMKKILNTCTVAKLLCHGFVDPAEQVVAWILANDGTLLPANNVVANTPLGRKHRFGWHECQTLSSAPRVIFSAACSSGRAYLIGLGERLGLFSTLRRFGTRTLVAPRWDVPAEVVLPIMDDAMERYLEMRCGVGEALHDACVHASKRHPRWLAWALSLEGHWL